MSPSQIRNSFLDHLKHLPDVLGKYVIGVGIDYYKNNKYCLVVYVDSAYFKPFGITEFEGMPVKIMELKVKI